MILSNSLPIQNMEKMKDDHQCHRCLTGQVPGFIGFRVELIDDLFNNRKKLSTAQSL